MLENDRMETASTEVTSIWRRNDIEKSTWRTHRYFVDFESRIHVKISTSNRCHNFHVNSPFKIDVISTNFPRGVSTPSRWRIDKDVSIGLFYTSITVFYWNNKYLKILNGNVHGTSAGHSCVMSLGQNDGTFWGRPRDVGHGCFLNLTY